MTPWLGVLVGGLAGIGILLTAWLLRQLGFRADHIISGTVNELISTAISNFLDQSDLWKRSNRYDPTAIWLF